MDKDKLVDTVTRIIMERLNGAGGPPAASAGPSAVLFGNVPAAVVGDGIKTRQGTSPSDTAGADYIVMTQAAFRAFHGGAIPAALGGVPAAVAGATSATAGCSCGGGGCASCCGGAIDLTGKKLISERELKQSGAGQGDAVLVCPKAIVTALARDYANATGINLVRQ
ncbi:MAG: hypothetical protein LBR27_09090 [Bifidobacteriaceae bacterium]|jgi:hypothetical protein|nr:hypothetical protein [Bifidobacteriaceae bacterium]